jgi:hypothetical protein
MNRRLIIAGLCASILGGPAAWAQGFADSIVQQLRQQGYNGISVHDTWLGRTRIVGQSGSGSREIIIDPRTGEILRDLFQGSGGSGSRIVDDRQNSGRDSRNDSDDDRDDDSDDDDNDEDDSDNSGSSGGGGSENSGSGSGGSGGDDNDDDEDD